MEPLGKEKALLSISGLDAFQSQVIGARGKFLVDFWGPSCAPCIDLNRVLETLEGEYRDRLVFVKVNADDEIEIATQYSVRGLPSLLLIQDGQIIHRWIGNMSGPSLKSKLDKALAK